MTYPVSIGLGANLGDRELNLRIACQHLAETDEFSLLRVSRVYQTPPFGPPDQPDYLNAAVLIETETPPQALLEKIKAIEIAMGRVSRRRWGERVIDLDILLYADRSIDNPGLMIPHAGIDQRPFVVEPLIDLHGDRYVVPGMGDLATLRARLRDSEISVFPCAALWESSSNPMRSTSD